ncbi:MAG: DUF3108 domain-containing protein [Candidatus Hydrogenedentota bacterium]
MKKLFLITCIFFTISCVREKEIIIEDTWEEQPQQISTDTTTPGLPEEDTTIQEIIKCIETLETTSLLTETVIIIKQVTVIDTRYLIEQKAESIYFYFDRPDWNLKYDTINIGETYFVLKETALWNPIILASGQLVWVYKGVIKPPEKIVKPKPPPPPLIAKKEPEIVYPVKVNNAFLPGEVLKYKITYFGIPAGRSEIGVAEGQLFNNRKTYYIRMRTESISLFWFKVKDILETYLDKEGLFTYRYEKHLREALKKKDEIVEIEPVKGIAIRTKNNEKYQPMHIQPFVTDVLGALYNIRTMDLQVGKYIEIPVFDGRKNYNLRIDVTKKELISVPAGRFKTILVIPRLQSEGIFMGKGDVEVWLTDDYLKIPVYVKAKIAVGSFVGKLIEYKLAE